MRKLLTFAALGLALSGCKPAYAAVSVPALTKAFLYLDGVCRGKPDPAGLYEIACDRRNVIQDKLRMAGQCFRYPEYTWYACKQTRQTKQMDAVEEGRQEP